MENEVIYIKLKEGCEPLKYFEKSYLENKSYYYNVIKSNKPEELFVDATAGNKYYIIALVYKNESEESGKEIIKAYLGDGSLIIDEKGYSIRYRVNIELNNCTSLKNICKMTDLDLDSDFGDKGYAIIEKSIPISQQIDFIINPPSENNVKTGDYSIFPSEASLHKFAQRSECCNRQYNLRKTMKHRSEFQRDYERIVHSKSFRRMVDKAQIYSAAKGDYYRTRMTHSQTVAQIARGIAEGLNVNRYLTEAIALGHDIGHTPFGHQGERTLDNILRNNIGIIKNADLYPDFFGGFKHNFQSVRVAASLEEEYSEIYGMDLSYQTLEGMLKHTKFHKKQFNNEKEYILKEFIDTESAEKMLHFDQEFCSTLEGQIVAISDEIAQRGHDLDDALSSGAMSFEEFKNFLTVKKIKKLEDIVNGVESDIKKSIADKHRLIDERELVNSRTVSAIISYFINDVIDNSAKMIDDYSDEAFEKNNHSIDKPLVRFSDEASMLCKYLETIITNKVINSTEVSLFDNNAATIVSGLFKAYYNNPRLLHKGTQRRIYIDTRKITQNVIDFEYGNHKIISKEIELITKTDLNTLDDEKKEEYKEKRKILVRNICDFIAGMTDTYALNEFRKIEKQL